MVIDFNKTEGYASVEGMKWGLTTVNRVEQFPFDDIWTTTLKTNYGTWKSPLIDVPTNNPFYKLNDKMASLPFFMIDRNDRYSNTGWKIGIALDGYRINDIEFIGLYKTTGSLYNEDGTARNDPVYDVEGSFEFVTNNSESSRIFPPPLTGGHMTNTANGGLEKFDIITSKDFFGVDNGGWFDWQRYWKSPLLLTIKDIPIFYSDDAEGVYLWLTAGDFSHAINKQELEDYQKETEENRQDNENTDTSVDPIDGFPNQDAEDDGTSTSDVTGTMNCFGITNNQLKDFFSWFWNQMTDDIQESSWIKYVLNAYGDLRQNIVSVKKFPFSVPLKSAKQIVIGRWGAPGTIPTLDTGKNKALTHSWQGKIQKGAPIGFMNYAPYTKVWIYLPFIGLREIPTNMVMGKTVKVEYYTDFVSGALDCQIYVQDPNGNWTMIVHETTQVGVDVSYTLDSGLSTNDIVSNAISNGVVSGVASIISSAGAGKGGEIVGGVLNQFSHAPTEQSSLTNTPPVANNIFRMPRDCRVLYLRPTAPSESSTGVPKSMGKMWVRYKKLDDIKDSGFTMCQNVKLQFGHTLTSEDTTVTPTDEERNEIKNLLESGVYV